MRSRNIKPGFFQNEELAELEPFYRLLFIGLWCAADREGRLEDRPKRIKAELFPFDSVDVEQGLCQLESKKFISRYQVDEIRIIEVCKFKEHQSPHGTEKDSKLPCRNGVLTVNKRQKNGYVIVESSQKTVNQQLDNSALTVKEQLSNALIPDSLIPDSLIPDSLIPDSLIPDSLIPDSLIPDSLIPEIPPQSPKGEVVAKPKKPEKLEAEKPDSVPEQVWLDFQRLRKEKKAPFTKTALAMFEKQAGLAGISLAEAMTVCCSRGWRGFEASWMHERNGVGGLVSTNTQEARERRNNAVAEAFLEKLRMQQDEGGLNGH